MAAAAPKGSSTYTFASQPRAVASQRTKYRDPQDELAGPRNIMHDPRIVRGSTYRAQVIPSVTQPDPIQMQKQQETLRKTQARRRAQQANSGTAPAPVSGRQHMDVQTEPYLEELTDRVEESDVTTQTDAFLDRPPSPLFVPAKSGVDVATQIEEGELFDFDLEVRPVLEVLIGKTVEQAMMEVMEEDELEMLRTHQNEFEELRSAELIELQRKEEAARRTRDEKARRVAEAREIRKQEAEARDKIAARSFAHTYLSGLVPSVFGALNDGGYFYDQREREIESEFMPWLMNNVESKLVRYVEARGLLDALVNEVVKKRVATYGSSDNIIAGGDDNGDDDDNDDRDNDSNDDLNRGSSNDRFGTHYDDDRADTAEDDQYDINKDAVNDDNNVNDDGNGNDGANESAAAVAAAAAEEEEEGEGEGEGEVGEREREPAAESAENSGEAVPEDGDTQPVIPMDEPPVE